MAIEGTLKHRQVAEISEKVQRAIRELHDLTIELDQIQSDAYRFMRSVEDTGMWDLSDDIYAAATEAREAAYEAHAQLERLEDLTD